MPERPSNDTTSAANCSELAIPGIATMSTA